MPSKLSASAQVRLLIAPDKIMKVFTQRLFEIDPTLHLLNNDGQPGITVIIPGAGWDDFFCVRPDTDYYTCSISDAQVQGCVYLLSWRSGFHSYYPWTCIANFHRIEENAHRLGHNLKKFLLKLSSLRSQKIRLIGHSLGAHVITTALMNDDWTDLDLSDVILMGAAVGEDDYEDYEPRQFWRRCASQVRRRIVNCYSEYDIALWWRKFLRGDQLESIGRTISSYGSSRIRNISFTRTLSDGDHNYLSNFDHVINRVYPNRKRSSQYQIQVICDCPWCNREVMIDADCDTPCPWKCGTILEYRTSDERCYYVEPETEVACPANSGCSSTVRLEEDADYYCDHCECTIRVIDGEAEHEEIAEVRCEADRRLIAIVPIEENGTFTCPCCSFDIKVRDGEAVHEELD